MTQSTTQSLLAILAKIAVLLSLLGSGGAAVAPATFGSGVGSTYSGIAAIAPNPTINAPTCPISTSNLDSSVGLNTCPGLNSIWVATTTYPTTAMTLGPVGASTSTTSTSLTFNAGTSSTQPLNNGDPCLGFLSTAPTSSFSVSAIISQATTTAATSTVTIANLYSSATTFNTTSTAGSIYTSSTLKVVCFNTAN